ncbi:MAG: hypothetical protein K2X93_06150 [Candidatus Obscuribacterales bacterium]|nr:hypothetical protein [Candidatus Obscuribacterales bacterium]
MIRLSKPVKVMEWGAGTNTTNQVWTEMGKGKITKKPKTVDGITTIVIHLDNRASKSNSADDTIKLAQQGEAMTPTSAESWGEVAYGRLKSINEGSEGGGTLVEVEVKVAIKVGK